VSCSLTHLFGPNTACGPKLLMGGEVYECEAVLCAAMNGNVWDSGSGGVGVPDRSPIGLIGEWTRLVKATVLASDSRARGETFWLPVVTCASIVRGAIFGMTVYPSICKLKSCACCICVTDIPAAQAMTWNLVSDGCGISMLTSLDRLGWGGVAYIFVVEKFELGQRFDDTCGLSSFCDL
jgi:hypothetical protein